MLVELSREAEDNATSRGSQSFLPTVGTGGFQVAGLNISFDCFTILNVSFNIKTGESYFSETKIRQN
jgi:hypothetical protein